MAAVLDRVLRQADARQAGGVERRAVGAAGIPPGGDAGAIDAKIFEWLEELREHLPGLRRSENRRAANPSRAAVDVEVAVELRPLFLRLLGGAEVLLDIRLRAEQA